MKIRDYYGDLVSVGDDIYVVTAPGDMGLGYPVGTHVRLIALRDHPDEPGWHMNPDFVSVTDINARCAQFVGCRKVALKPLIDSQRILNLPKLLTLC